MKKEEICFMSACKMAEKIKTQELSSREITETIIERIEKINPKINAYCTPTFELAREMANDADNAVKKGKKIGLLHGIPTSIKDLFETKGIRTTFGCKIYENNVPEEDEIVIKRLKEAGIVILGKTNTPSFGHKSVTDNLIFGTTRNPWNLEKTPGGSSGGAAAAIASGLGPLALGSDGGGSIRIPASFCGIYGLKPNFGRIPRIFTKAAFPRLSHYGPIVRNVKDAALMLDVMAGPDELDKFSFLKKNTSYLDGLKEKPQKKLKIGYSMDLGFIKAIDPEVKKSVLDAVVKFESLGWSVENVKLRLKKPYPSFVGLVISGLAYDFKPFLKEWREKLTPTFIKMVEAGMNYSSFDLMRLDLQRRDIYNVVAKYFKNYDILITPTTAVPAFVHGIMFPPKINNKAVSPTAWMSYTFPFNLTWNPAASIPCGWNSEGLPIGMQIIGKQSDELTVLQVSKAFEEIAPWQEKKPQFD